MRLRDFVILAFALVCFLTASATLWYYAIRDERKSQTAATMSVPWVKSRSGSTAGPTEKWSLPKLRACAADPHQAPEHRAQAISLLAQADDWEGVETLISQLDDPLPLVRGRAATAIRHILGTDFNYRAADERPKRLASIKGICRYWESRKANPPVIRFSDASLPK